MRNRYKPKKLKLNLALPVTLRPKYRSLFIVISCKLPHLPDRVSVLPSDMNTFEYGSVVSYQCPDGFLLQGNPQATCETTGVWSVPPPRCEGKLFGKNKNKKLLVDSYLSSTVAVALLFRTNAHPLRGCPYSKISD